MPGNASEATVFFGYTAIFLTLYGIVAIRGKSREYKFFLTALIFFALMSFGPSLELRLFSWHWKIAMPYALFQQIPFFSDFRVPARFGGMVALCAAILSAFGWQALTKPIVSRRKLALMTALPIGLVLLENLVAPFPNHFDPRDPARIPFLLIEKIKADPVPGVVLNIPALHEDWLAIWMQTFHHKPSVTGVLARPTPYQIDYYDNMDLSGWFAPDPAYRYVCFDPLAPVPYQGAFNRDGRFAWGSRPNPWNREKVGRFCYFFDLRYLLLVPDGMATDLAGRLRRELLPIQTSATENKAWLGLLEKQPERFPIAIDAGSVADNYYFTAHFSQPAGGCRWMIGKKRPGDFPAGRSTRHESPRRAGLSLPAPQGRATIAHSRGRTVANRPGRRRGLVGTILPDSP